MITKCPPPPHQTNGRAVHCSHTQRFVSGANGFVVLSGKFGMASGKCQEILFRPVCMNPEFAAMHFSVRVALK